MLRKTKGQLTRSRHARKGTIGSSFDGLLAEQGILEKCEEQAIKQILADQIKGAMEKDRITKACYGRTSSRRSCRPTAAAAR